MSVENNGWMPIDELSMDGRIVDIFDPKWGRICNASFSYHYWLNGKPVGHKSWAPANLSGPPPKPTHYMLPPEPPQ